MTGPVTRVEEYEITVQLNDTNWKHLRFYRNELAACEPPEKPPDTFYKPGDMVVIDCRVPRKVDYDYRHYNGCWAVVNRVGSSGNLIVHLAGKTMSVLRIDVDPIDNPSTELSQTAQKINALLERDDLDEFDRHMLELYLRRQFFTPAQQHRLNQIWD